MLCVNCVDIAHLSRTLLKIYTKAEFNNSYVADGQFECLALVVGPISGETGGSGHAKT